MSEANDYLAPAAIGVFLFREILDIAKGRGKLALDELKQLRREMDIISVHVENFKATLQLTQKVASDLNVAFERLRAVESRNVSAHDKSNL